MNVRATTSVERRVHASPEDVWELWTTKDGIEAWWGPDGFKVRVRSLDVRAGGTLDYSMRATGADQVEFMRKAGMPLETHHQLRFTEVEPPVRLAYVETVDFVPGVQPYEVHVSIELTAENEGTLIVVTFDRMHDEHWTRLAVMGREEELGRLEKLLAART